MMVSSKPNSNMDQSKKAKFPGAHILVVDDEKGTRRSLAHMLRRMGYQTSEAASGQEALRLLGRHDVDLVVLDLKMPGMSGVEVLEAAHSMAPDPVFIILTAYGTLESAISGIRHGAFDYLLKPSTVDEIVDTIEAGLSERRQAPQDDPVDLLERALHTLKNSSWQEGQSSSTASSKGRFLQAPGVTVDLQRKLVVVRGEPVDLTPTEFDILVCMMRNRDCVLSSREIVVEIRGYEMDERDASDLLRSHIHRLREKVEPVPSDPSFIRTVRGEGYIFSTKPESSLDL